MWQISHRHNQFCQFGVWYVHKYDVESSKRKRNQFHGTRDSLFIHLLWFGKLDSQMMNKIIFWPSVGKIQSYKSVSRKDFRLVLKHQTRVDKADL